VSQLGAAAEDAAGRSRYPGDRLARWAVFLLDHVLPATVFLLAGVGNAYVLVSITRGEGPAQGLPLVEQVWLFLNRLVGTAFSCLIGILFAVRRPRANQRRGLIAELGTLLLHPRDRALRRNVGHQLLPAFIALAGTEALVFANLAPITETSTLFVVPGTVIGVIGLFFAIISLGTLGRSFGVFPEARRLVTRGPYRWVRHPLYLAEIVSAFGWLLVNFSIFTAINFLVFIGLQYWRAIFEERTLAAEFPEYGDYRTHTWRILPGIH
jgi:protein-S-isoprenylcysteine O-methyltransferase Ste14